MGRGSAFWALRSAELIAFGPPTPWQLPPPHKTPRFFMHDTWRMLSPDAYYILGEALSSLLLDLRNVAE